jgi:hypothetical protein
MHTQCILYLQQEAGPDRSGFLRFETSAQLPVAAIFSEKLNLNKLKLLWDSKG